MIDSLIKHDNRTDIKYNALHLRELHSFMNFANCMACTRTLIAGTPDRRIAKTRIN